MQRASIAIGLVAWAIVAAVASACGDDDDTAGDAGPVVYAWFPREFNDWNTSAIDWSALTHISYRSVEIRGDGTLSEPRPRDQVASLVEEAHAHGVAVTALVWGTTADGSDEYLANHRAEAADALVAYAADNGLDGLNVDDETWREDNAISGGSNRDAVTDFFRLLRDGLDAVRPGMHLSWASPPVISAQDRYGEDWFDYVAIADSVDAFAMMVYEMNPPSIGWTTGKQPIAGGGTVDGHPRDYVTAIADYRAATGGRDDRLLLGIANDRGGTEWDAQTDQPLSPIIGSPRALTPEQARQNADTWGRLFDVDQQVPWYRHANGDAFVQGWYEDDESLGAKMALARDEGLAGICLWVLDGSAEPPETFDLIHQFLR